MEKPLSRPRQHSGRRKPHRNPPPPPPQPHTHPHPHPKTLYDDVFGGPPRYGVPVLSPRTEDYLEIFGGFHVPSRSCSRVPVLDLPVAEGDEVSVDARGGGFDYSEVFRKGDGGDVGLLEFEVVSRSDDVGGSSYGDVGDDDAWTPEASDCLSEDSEFCGYDRTFSNGNPCMSVDGEIEYKMSFHKANHGIAPFNGVKRTSQIHSIPGFSYVVGETPQIEKGNLHQSKRQTSNTNSHLDYGMERVKGKEQKKVLSHSSSAISRGKSNDYDSIRQKQFGRVKSFPAETFVTISEISLRTAPSNLPPPSRPPPAFDIKTSDVRGSTSNWRKNSPERDCLPDYFDVQVDGGSFAVPSTAAMRKAMDEAQSQLKTAKELTEGRKDCLLAPEISGTKSDANYATKKGSLFVNSTSSRKDNRVQNNNHRVNNGAETSVKDKIRNSAGENRDEAMKGKVIESAVGSEQIWREKEGPTVHSEFVGDDRTGGAPDFLEGYDFFAQSKKSDQGSGIRDGMLGKEVFDTKVNGIKSREWREALISEEREVENNFVMIREKETGIAVREVTERKDLRKNEVIEKHSDTKHADKVPQTAPQNMETRAGRSDAIGEKNHMGSDAVEVCVGVFASAGRHTLEHINDDEDWMVTESNAQVQEAQGSSLDEKMQKEIVDREEYKRGPQVDALFSVVLKEEKTASGSHGSAEEILHYVANDARKEDVIEQVQNGDRLRAVVEQDKVKVLPKEHYPKEGLEHEGTRESAKGHSKLNVHKPEGVEMTLGHSYEKHELKQHLKEANQQNEPTKLKMDFCKNGEQIPLNWAVEQKENESIIVDLLEKEEMEKTLKTAFLPEDKVNVLSSAYQMDEGEKEPDEATKLEEIGNCPLESCGTRSANEASPEQGAVDESLKEAGKYVRTNKTLASRHEKADILEHENAGHYEEAVNESDDDIGWEIIDEGLREVIDVRELGFLNLAREKISVDEVSVPHYSADGQFDLANSSNPETRPEARAPQVNRYNVQTEDGFDIATPELTEPLNERASRHFKRDLKSKEPGSDFFKAAAAVHEEKYIDSRMMDSATAVSSDQTNCSISCEEKVMEQETVEFKDDSELSDVPLHQGEEISTSSCLNCEFDGGTIRDTPLPDLVDGTAQQQGTALPEEKKDKRAVPEARDTVRFSRDQEAELERLRKIEEEKEREREREKDRMVVDKVALEARERAISEARERFEKTTVERATAEASRRAMMEARERLEKACAEARERLFGDKSAAEERLRLERAAVERAIAEARGRAAERAKADRSSSDNFSSPRYGETRQTSFSDNKVSGEAKSYGSVEVESAQRCRARLERHRRTAERAEKALAEKNMRDLLAQREQAERSRLAETLDADVRRWSKGKEGNLRALLSTLQYILGPESGWQPIPLTEVITSAAVKKAYRKATLCVHPDKLQQRGANTQQKYICEKVFDLLKEGWNKFTSEER